MRMLVVGALCVIALAGPSPGEARADDERLWAALDFQGTKVGRIEMRRGVSDETYVTDERLAFALEVRRGLEKVEISTRQVETLAGRPMRAERRTRIGTVRSSVRAEVDGERVRVTRRRGDALEQRELALPDDWLLSNALGVALEAALARGESRLRYVELDLERLELVRVELARDGTAVRDDGAIVLVKSVESHDGGVIVSRVRWLPAERRLVESFGLLGRELEVRPCARSCASAFEVPIDLAAAHVELPYRLPRAATEGRIRYVIERLGADEAWPFPRTDEQQVALRGKRAIVTVCASCETESASTPTQAELEQLSSPTLWLQSDHALLRTLAGARLQAASPAEIRSAMRGLVERVRKRLDRPAPGVGFATALAAARARGGDCTEHALLLAALGRAKGIPTRVVAGMVYSRDFRGPRGFVSHMWVQAWDGERWTSFDSGSGPFSAAHIALALSGGSPQELASAMNVLHEVRIVAAARIATE